MRANSFPDGHRDGNMRCVASRPIRLHDANASPSAGRDPGQCFRAVAQARSLSNFVYIEDCNGGQNDGYIDDNSPIRKLKERFEAFGFAVREIDGHDHDAIIAANAPDREKPLAILARTVKGKGIPALEGNPDAHYAKIPANLARKWKVTLS